MPFLVSLLIGILSLASPSFAEWKVSGESNVYYTDDAALFSATRRLSRNQDPTQPVIDSLLANQGDDMVFEPLAHITNTFPLMGRPTQLGLRGQGFVFMENNQFDHGSLSVDASHHLTSSTRLLLRYFFGPDLFLGKNEVRPLQDTGENPPTIKKEEVTTHYFAGGLAQHIPSLDDARLILYGRYGLREYDKPFTQRDTRFWTIGTHVEWTLSPKLELALGYHYERGLADGRKQPALQDDTSYFNHFVTAELELEITERLGMGMALHYEFNGWTTGIEGDERRGQHENVVQGDIAVRYQVNDILQITGGFQGAHRKESFERGLKNLNTWLGAQWTF
jgi:hypothetical protein